MRRLTRIKFYDHPVLEDHEFQIIDHEEEKADQYITLIIGQNGSGKSKLLEAIVQVLLFLDRKRSNSRARWTEGYSCEIELFDGSKRITVHIKNGEVSVTGKNQLSSLKDFLPSAIVVNSYTFNDKFPLSKEHKRYFYCGLRAASNNVFVNIPTENCFNNLVEIILSSDRQNLLDEVFTNLDFQFRITAIYERGRKVSILTKKTSAALINSVKLTGEVTPEQRQNFAAIIAKETGVLDKSKTRRFGDDAIRRFLKSDEEIDELLLFLASNSIVRKARRGYTIESEFTLHWSDDLSEDSKSDNEKFKEHLRPFEVLKNIGIVRLSGFNVKRNEEFSFDEASSGEYHLLHLLSSVLRFAEEDGLVIIDEPEISLHPNWQNRFLHLLEPITSSFPGCQFVIATHSHLMVSSLRQKQSTLMTIIRDKGELVVNNLESINTFGWSAEQILFDVFGMVTDRNYYLSAKVQKLIDEMAKDNPDDVKVDQLKTELREYDLDDLNTTDPFHRIIKDLLDDDVQ